MGEIVIEAQHGDQPSQNLPLVIVEKNCPALLGRNWLAHFTLDWGSIKMVSRQQKNSSSSLLNEFQEILNDELGLIKPFEANLVVDPAASP